MINFTENELEQIKFALEHLYDSDLSNLCEEKLKDLESAMKKLEIKFTSQL